MKIKAFIQRHPLATYFGLVLLISYGSFVLVVGPKLLRGGAEQPTDAFLLFPIIVVGVCVVGITLTGITGGRPALRDLFARVGRWQVGAQWYAVYAFALWIVVAVVAMRYGKRLVRQSSQQRQMETAKTALE